MNLSRLLPGRCLLATLLAIVARASVAQEAMLEEIVVSATRRETHVLETPMSITALTTEVLRDSGADSFSDFARLVPGLTAIDSGRETSGTHCAACNPALAQAGELRAALPSASQARQHIRGELGDVLNGSIPGRMSEHDVTVYKSLGIAAQDLATAQAVYECARLRGVGVSITL